MFHIFVLFPTFLFYSYALDPPFGQLQIKGPHVIDSNGNIAQLRGMSLFPPDCPPPLATFHTEETIVQLKNSWYGNVIRVPTFLNGTGHGGCCGGWMTANRSSDYLHLKTMIEAAIKHGIYVIVDWHAFEDPMTEGAKDFFGNISKTYGS